MSVIDTRTKVGLVVAKTPTGLYFLATNMNNIAKKKKCINTDNFITTLDTAFKNRIELELIKYKGEVPKKFNNIRGITSQELTHIESNLSRLRCRNTRQFEDTLAMLKTIYSDLNVNQYYITQGIIYDAPFVNINGNRVCYFTPKFEGIMGVDKIKVIDNCFVYDYTTNIYILTDVAQRHTPSVIRDRLIINLKTGRITCEYKDVINDKYCEYYFEFNKQTYSWEKIRLQTTTIDGYKIA